ncbi:hypothetical protein D3C81_1802030 [compost metagenome]
MPNARYSTFRRTSRPVDTAAEWISAKAFSDSSSNISSNGIPSPAPARASSSALTSPLGAKARV